MHSRILFATILVALSAVRADAQPEVARRAKAVLEKHCHACHGKDGSNSGKFGFVLDAKRLVEGKKVVPGKPDESRIFQRLTADADPMPPLADDELRPITTRPTDAEKAAVRDWIAAGAPDFAEKRPNREFLTAAAVWDVILADLRALPERDRPNVRYFTAAHLFNAQFADDELLTVRHGLSKLVNSLSWRNQVVAPTPVGRDGIVFRIRLSDYGWDAKTWDCVTAANPFARSLDSTQARAVGKLTGSTQPAVRADWFVAAASRPPLYHDILGLPTTAAELERGVLGYEAGQNIAQNKVKRAGFNGSGVSENNRMIERHEIAKGHTWKAKNALWTGVSAYWKSYDFASNVNRQNLFQYPLGPGPMPTEFAHDGGEIIFNLPNGLQAYMLIDAAGKRIDKGPIEIVSDTRKVGLGAVVVNGVSCISCHSGGIIAKDDEVRAHVRKATLAGFSEAEIVRTLTQYPDPQAMRTVFAADAARFTAALQKTGAHASRTEPVTGLVRQFGKELDITLLAAEVELRPDAFRKSLLASDGEIIRVFGPLLTGGTVKREVAEKHFAALAKALGRGD